MSGQPKEVFISCHTETGGGAVRKACAALELSLKVWDPLLPPARPRARRYG